MFNSLNVTHNYKLMLDESLRTKEDITDELKKAKAEIFNQEHTQIFYSSFIEAIDSAIKEINNGIFPDLTGKKNYYYRYAIVISLISIDIIMQKIDLADSKSLETIYSIDENKGQYIYYIPLLTVSEYSKRNNYSEDNVRQWIRRGRMSSTKKIGGNWMIPVLAEVKENQHISERIEFSWRGRLPNHYGEYDFMNEYTNIIRYHSRKNKNEYKYRFYNQKSAKSIDIIIDSKNESGKFDSFLRGNTDILSDEEKIFVIDKKNSF